MYVQFSGYAHTARASRAIARKIVKHAGRAGMTATWDGSNNTAVLLQLSAADQVFLQGMMDDEWVEVFGAEAESHRTSRLLRAWRIQAFCQKVARRKIRCAVMEWGLRPGGPLYAVAARRFGTQGAGGA
jgi:hypothetical protein